MVEEERWNKRIGRRERALKLCIPQKKNKKKKLLFDQIKPDNRQQTKKIPCSLFFYSFYVTQRASVVNFTV